MWERIAMMGFFGVFISLFSFFSVSGVDDEAKEGGLRFFYSYSKINHLFFRPPMMFMTVFAFLSLCLRNDLTYNG